MRRYAVRVLIAVLTFGLGVALSGVFGLFKFGNTKFLHQGWERSECRTRSRAARSAFLTVDSHQSDPLRLVYLGSSSNGSRRDEGRVRFSVRNNSDQIVSGYSITASEIWGRQGSSAAKALDWTAYEVLEPGETSMISFPRGAEGSSLRVARVDFQDGSVWNNPRVPR